MKISSTTIISLTNCESQFSFLFYQQRPESSTSNQLEKFKNTDFSNCISGSTINAQWFAGIYKVFIYILSPLLPQSSLRFIDANARNVNLWRFAHTFKTQNSPIMHTAAPSPKTILIVVSVSFRSV